MITVIFHQYHGTDKVYSFDNYKTFYRFMLKQDLSEVEYIEEVTIEHVTHESFNGEK